MQDDDFVIFRLIIEDGMDLLRFVKDDWKKDNFKATLEHLKTIDIEPELKYLMLTNVIYDLYQETIDERMRIGRLDLRE